MLDREQLSHLMEDVGRQGFAEVVALFLQETDDGMEKLLRSDDPSCLASDLHFLKGAALNLGLREFGDMCHQGEVLARAGQASKLDRSELQLSYQAGRSALLTFTRENQG